MEKEHGKTGKRYQTSPRGHQFGGLSQAALLLAVLLGMRSSCLFGVMSSVGGVPVRGMGMVAGLLVVSGVVVFASFCVGEQHVLRVLLPSCGARLLSWTWRVSSVWLSGGRLTPTGKQRNSYIDGAFLYDKHSRSIECLGSRAFGLTCLSYWPATPESAQQSIWPRHAR